MENNKPLTLADLAKFTEEVLLPAFDDRFESIDKRFESIDKRFDHLEAEMRTGFNDINAELFAIKQEIAEVKIRLERLEKRTKEDSDAAGHDIARLQDKLEKTELRVAALEGK